MVRKGVADYLRRHEHKGGIVVIPNIKVVYMKSCKTAGTSIYRGVLKNSFDNTLNTKDSPIEFYAWLNSINDGELSDYYIFSVVRNPYERLLSAATHFHLELNDLCNRFRDITSDKKIRIHTLPCNLYTHIEDVQFVDEIIKFETLDQDINKVFSRLNIPNKKLPHINKSNHLSYREAFDKKSIDFVNKHYALDLFYYGYSF